MKGILLFLFSIASYCCMAQTKQEAIMIRCGINEVKVDSFVNTECTFFTDSLVKIVFENPQALHKIQAVYIAEGREPVSAWFNIDPDSRAVVFSPRSSLSAIFCSQAPARLMIYYHANSMNIRTYIINLDL